MAKSERVRCDYPMSQFYIYKDEVLPNEVVSTTEDCKVCEEEICDVNYCLMKKGT